MQNFLQKNIISELEIKHFIMNEQSKSNLNYDNIKIKIKDYIIKDAKLIIQLISKDKLLVLFNSKFFNSFIANLDIKPINILLSN